VKHEELNYNKIIDPEHLHLSLNTQLNKHANWCLITKSNNRTRICSNTL